MKIKNTLFSISLLLIIISSCSIEKRVHSNGYHMDWSTHSSRLQQKEITLTKKHKTFNRFELNEQNHQEKTKPIPALNAGALKTAENKSKTLKTTINTPAAFPKVARMQALDEIKPITTDEEDEEDKNSRQATYAILGVIIGLVIMYILLGGDPLDAFNWGE